MNAPALRSGARRALALVLAMTLAGPAHADGMPGSDAEAAARGDAVPPKPRPKPRRKAPPPVPAATMPPPQPPEITRPEPVRQLAPDEVVPILGRKVVGPSNEELGRVVNVLVDHLGRARAAVIDFGGFLGVGNRRIAVDWGELVFKPGVPDRQIGLNMTREQIQRAREFKENAPKPVDVASPPRPGDAGPEKKPN